MKYLFNLDLDTRVVDLEENGGGDGNSSVAELEVRVETLEGTAEDHETRLTAAETDIEGFKLAQLINAIKILKFRSSNCLFYFPALETTTSDQEVRLSAAEENIQGIMQFPSGCLEVKTKDVLNLGLCYKWILVCLTQSNFQLYRQQM